MTNLRDYWKGLFGAVAIGLFLSACSGTQPSRFYTLSDLSTGDTGTNPAQGDLVVGVGPITLPRYLDRPEVVQRTSPNEFQFAEFDRWGEPLGDVFPRTMVDNLSVLLETDRVFALPRRRSTALDYQVEVQVIRFDADVGGDAVLDARWEVFDKKGQSLYLGRSTLREPVVDEGVEPVVAAMSQTVASLSREIARAISLLPRQN